MPVTNFAFPDKYKYLNGFGSYHEYDSYSFWSESIKGALPIESALGLYAEKLSGTAFTAPRSENLQSWMYRILPSAAHSAFEPYNAPWLSITTQGTVLNQIPNQLRWDPFDFSEGADWISGQRLLGGCGNPATKRGVGIRVFAAGKSMEVHTAIYSSDGDELIVIQHGTLDIQTEFGRLFIRPNEIAVIPRGIRYHVVLPNGLVRGYILELYQGHFALPELGPIGSNCLANPRDFQIPAASFDDETDATWTVVNRFNGTLFAATQDHTPFDVVAWHGRYYPFKYDLGRYSVIGSTSFDHPDPSIFTVLTAPSEIPGTAVADFVIFPPRWLVQEDTFRPPWYHCNTMSEFMGLICGNYDAKAGGGFKPAGASLHNVMAAHGPDASTFEKASNDHLQPQQVGEGSMAFMFESSLMIGVTDWALKTCQKVQEDYNKHSWTKLQRHFKRPA